MNVICYVNTLSDGGAERAMSVLANGLARLNHCVTVVTDYCTPNEYPLDQSVSRNVLDGELGDISSKGRFKRTLKRIAQLRHLCKRKKADILISFMSDANMRAIIATSFLKTKNLISVRIDPRIGYKNPMKAFLAKLLYPAAEGCVFQTEDAQMWFSKSVQRKSRVIFNPVSDVFFSNQGMPLKEKRIVSCGRLSKQKRFDLLINAFDQICDVFPEYTLEVYGVGDLKHQLQEQITNLNRADRIRLMGRCEDISNAIKDASLFVLSSDYEGLPNALMEAMALGLPVISTDCGGGGASALIHEGVDGWIVPCGDSKALAKAIDTCLSDPVEAKKRGDKAGEKAKGFSAECVVAQWEAYLKELIGEEYEH